MKKILLSIFALALSSMPARAVGPFIGYVQISTASGVKQSGGFNVGNSTVTKLCFDDATCQTTAGGGGGSGITGDSSFSAYGGGGGSFSAGHGMTGQNNTALGFQAMGNVTDKNLKQNLAIGTNALFLGGDYNTGEQGNNLAIGYNALSSLANFGGGLSFENSAIGAGAMANSVQSTQNTAIGYLAMSADTGGTANTCIGLACLSTIVTSQNNTAIGYNAGGGDGNHTANRDTMAGTSNSTLIGSGSTAMHPISANPFATPTNTIVLGYHSTSECTDCTVFGATDISRPMRVSIGTTTAYSTLWVDSGLNINFGAASLPPFDNYAVKVTTVSTGTPDFAVDVFGGVKVGRMMTAAQIRATSAKLAGETANCSDCVTVPVCISTGTSANQWSLITNRGTACN